MSFARLAHVRLLKEPAWPDPCDRRLVFLLDASSPIERYLLLNWLHRRRPEGVNSSDFQTIFILASRKRRAVPLDPRFDAALAAVDEPLFVPLRVIWLPKLRDGLHAVRLRDLLVLGDPRDPGILRQLWVLLRHPERCCIVEGESATASEVRRRWRELGGIDTHLTASLAEFAARQAALALERAERRLRGARYKVPRFVYEEILARPDFRGDLTALARELGRPEVKVAKEAARYLREIAATHSTHMIDLVAHLNRRLYTRGYAKALHYDRAELNRIYSLAQRHPVVFLPTHKSLLDHMVLAHALYENGLPPTHTAGGINLNVFPVASLFRRSGVFFIRRSFRDNPVYKHVLRSYIDYLVEKRFSLEWYIEGTRSRTGKLLPPRIGLLAYVVEAYQRGRSEDVFLIPISIVYDQIQAIHSYVAEQRGAAKPKERLGMFFRLLRGRGLHQQFGNVHIRFGEPLSMRGHLGTPEALRDLNDDERARAIEALAVEAAVRINRVTPITPTSLLTLAMLGADHQAATRREISEAVGELLHYARQRKLPTTSEFEELHTEEALARTLDALVGNRVVSLRKGVRGPVYVIGPDQELTAAYYRNAIIHFFVNGAISELALARAAESHVGNAVAALWEETLRLRNLLQFEFFFSEPDAFQTELRTELALRDPAWQSQLAQGHDAAASLLRRTRPCLAPRVLRPFVDSYLIVSEVLNRLEPVAPLDERAFLDACLRLGRQYQVERRIRSGASVSTVLFQTGLQLAEARGLLAPGGGDLAGLRAAFAGEIHDTLQLIDVVEGLDAARRGDLAPHDKETCP